MARISSDEMTNLIGVHVPVRALAHLIVSYCLPTFTNQKIKDSIEYKGTTPTKLIDSPRGLIALATTRIYVFEVKTQTWTTVCLSNYAMRDVAVDNHANILYVVLHDGRCETCDLWSGETLSPQPIGFQQAFQEALRQVCVNSKWIAEVTAFHVSMHNKETKKLVWSMSCPAYWEYHFSTQISTDKMVVLYHPSGRDCLDVFDNRMGRFLQKIHLDSIACAPDFIIREDEVYTTFAGIAKRYITGWWIPTRSCLGNWKCYGNEHMGVMTLLNDGCIAVYNVSTSKIDFYT